MICMRTIFSANGCNRVPFLFKIHSCYFVTSVILSNQKNLGQLLRSMSKSDHPRDTLRHVKYRQKREKGGQKMPAPSRIDVQVIGSGARGTPKSVVVSTDYSRYLFNCGEGTQRIAQEHKMKLAKLENVFITHKSWENMGGLLGMALTLESIKVPQITLHGPEGIEKVVQMAKSFNSQHSTIKLEKKDLAEGRFEDSALCIDYVLLKKSDVEKSRLSPDVDDQDPVAKKARLSLNLDNPDYSVAYICRPHPPLQKLLIEKCVELGVPSGPICGQLKEGETVTLEDGRVITPDQVLSPPEISRPIIVLECPTEEYLQSLVSCEEFSQYQGKGSNSSPNLIVHMTPARVMEHALYQTWMNKFGGETNHLVINELTSSIMFEGVYRIQAMLNLLDEKIFPLLPRQVQKETLTQTEPHVTLARTNLSYQYRPNKGFNSEQCIVLDNEKFVDMARKQEGVTEELEKLSKCKQLNGQSEISDTYPSYPEVIFLGTGSSIPSKVRNVSCILLQTQLNRFTLLDCGEGSLGQLYNHYGNQVDEILMNLDAVFVSHMHADHHMGMFGVLEARRQVMESRGKTHTPVLLLAPVQMTRWLKFYSQHIPQSHDYIRLVSLQSLLPHQLEATLGIYNSVLEDLQLLEFRPVMVDHCKNAFGVCLTHRDGWKLVYSGDTMPCNRLVEAGKNCDLLIHEATMEDELQEEAKQKTHSTTSQAIDIGVRMEAKFILLTHFSQRYSKIPVLSDNISDKVGIAFDNMRIRLKDVNNLPQFLPALKVMFAEEHASLEERTLKRKLNKNKSTIKGRLEIQDLLAEKAAEKS